MKKYIKYLFFFVAFAIGLELNDDDIYDSSWALIVGVNDYQNVRDLNYAVEDALAMKNIFINTYGFPRSNVRVLINGEATQSNIMKGLSELVKSVGDNDRVVFYFAGHGETATLGIEGGDMGFLIPVDGDVEDLYLTAIPMDELKRISSWSKAKHMLFLVDACYGGLAAMNTRAINTKSPNYIDKISKDISRQIITAGGKEEKVQERDDWEHSAFTKNLISGLRENRADYNEDGIITGAEIGMYVQEKVTIDTDNFQTPQIRKFTSHEGEILFISDQNTIQANSRSSTEALSVEEQLQALLLMMNQQNQSPQDPSIMENQRVIKPGSIGLNSKNPAQEFMVEGIVFRPSIMPHLAYRGKFKLSIDASDEMCWSRSVIFEIEDVLEIPGETLTGIYNFDTGNVD